MPVRPQREDAEQAVLLLEIGGPLLDVAGALILREAVPELGRVRYHRQDPRWGHLVRLRVAVRLLTLDPIGAIRIARSLQLP